jgi:hypothetical protein
MAVFVALMFGMQYLGGAYQAEYDAHADEAAHFVSSLLVRDYLAQFPWPSPLPWAMDYYLHYPKVAIGHWPPGYYALQGVWWLVFPPGRESAMALNLVLGAGVMTLFWVLVGRLGVPKLVMGGAGVVLLTLPVMQEALAQVMAELPALLAATVFLWALTRVQESPGRSWLMAVWLALFAAFAVKQTSVGLAAAPVLALAMGGGWRKLPRGPLLLWPAVVGLAAALLLSWQYAGSLREVVRWSGSASTKMAWGIPQVGEAVGAGMVVAAALGAVVAWRRREPVLVSALAIVASFAICSYYVRAFRETRHWIALLPPLVLLALAGYRWLAERGRWAPALLLAVVAAMPHRLYRQTPGGYGELAAQIRQPVRMLVSSSSGWAEGPWIAVAALREARPGSVIVRATKLLASSDWNGKNYQAKVTTAEDVERTLDGAGIELVVMHDDPADAAPRLSHHPLLRATVEASAAWRPCGAARELAAYCRQLPPRYPRRPLQIELNRLGVGAIAEKP